MTRELSRTDLSRTEKGARINNRHVPSKDREGDTAASSSTPASIDLQVLLSVLTVGAMEQIVATVKNAAGSVLVGVQPDGWASASPAIVSVDGFGRITANGGGGPVLITATLTAYSLSTSTPITVTAPDLVAASVSITPTTVSFQSGTAQLTATIKNAGGATLSVSPTSWTSADEAVCTVDSAGLVTFVGVGTANVTAHYNALVSNACVVTGVAGGGGGENTGTTFAKTTFEDGTLGPFTNPWGTGIDVIADPTPRATGKVARIQYATNVPAGQYDSNLALFPNPLFQRTLGDGLWFQGDFYLPADADMSPTLPNMILRKLFRFSDDRVLWPNHPVEFEIVGQGPDLQLYQVYGDASNNETVSIGTLTAGAWHRVKVQLKINSTFAAQDGIARIWLDTVLVFERTTQRWSDPNWSVGDVGLYQWRNWGVGYQLQNNDHTVTEDREWDNVTFTDSEALLPV